MSYSYLSIAKAIEVLEREKARLQAENPPAPVELVTERVIVNPADNEIIRSRDAAHAPVKVEPRPRRERKRRADRLAPTPFFITMGKPLNGDAGRIEEGHYVQDGDKVCLCDADGTPAGEWRRVEGHGALWTCRQMLRAKLAARTPGAVDHSPIRYPVLKY